MGRWDLNTIYSGFDSDEMKGDFSRCRELLQEKRKAVKDSDIDFSQWLGDFIKLEEELSALISSLNSYIYAVYAADTDNGEAIKAISQIDAIIVEDRAITVAINKKIHENYDKVQKILSENKDLAAFNLFFEEIHIEAQHSMGEEMEELAAELQSSAADSFSRLQQKLLSTLKDEKTNKTFNELRNDAYSPDERVRKSSFEAENRLLYSVQDAVAACLNEIKGATITLNKHRGWTSPLEKTLFQSRMTENTLNSLIAAMEESLPMWREYLSIKGKILGVEKFEFHHLFAPLVSSKRDKIWEFTEARNYLVEKFSRFSSDFGDFTKEAFDKKWIDWEIRPNKAGGAFCTEFAAHKQTRVLSNWTGTFSDVVTLAHELGHAYHYHCVKDLPVVFSQYPMTLAETASNFAEEIIKSDAIYNSKNIDEKALLVESRLQDACQVFVDILCRYYFENEVFNRRQDSELSADELSEIMVRAQKNTYGEEIGHHPLMWAVKSHYYSPDLDFYNFPYAFGSLFALAIHGKKGEWKDDFALRYKKILEETGKMTCEEVGKLAGFDLETKDFWMKEISTFKSDIDFLREYSNGRG
ncbi:MAG: M3 family oligoendopeptidase [Spirochaetaceae bacterium]|nr:M3 family oligoendopeptidase [Spirochaetaceae bacterium]